MSLIKGYLERGGWTHKTWKKLTQPEGGTFAQKCEYFGIDDVLLDEEMEEDEKTDEGYNEKEYDDDFSVIWNDEKEMSDTDESFLDYM